MFKDEVFFSGDARPLFIVGAPRSGTTFLHQVVNAHTQVMISDELRVVSWLVQEAKKLGEGFEKHGNPYPFNHGKDFAAYLMGNAGTLIRPFYLKLAEGFPDKRDIKYWGDKYPHYDEIIDVMGSVFPRARYIFIHRDLRDVICSVKKGHGWDIRRSAEYVTVIYARYIRKLGELNDRKVLGPEAVFHVGYERFADRTWEYATQIFRWLNVEIDPTMETVVTDIRATQSHSARKVGSGSTQKVKFDRNKSLGRWRNDLSDDEIAQMNAVLETIGNEVAAGERMVASDEERYSS